MTRKRMKDDEKCLDCDAVVSDPEFEGHGGDPFEPYEEGWHICGKKKPRVVKSGARSAPVTQSGGTTP